MPLISLTCRMNKISKTKTENILIITRWERGREWVNKGKELSTNW